jgi:Archaeal shikimate kinase
VVRTEIIEHSAITVVSALFNGIGVTLGINLPARISIKAGTGRIINNENEGLELVKTIIKREGLDQGSLDIEINSNIPSGIGLKSSSAITLAILRALRQHNGSNKTIMETIIDSCIISKEFGISYTGAMDDAMACHFGGLNFVNNQRFELIDRFSISKNKVYINIPSHKKSKVEFNEFKRQEFLGNVALKYAFDLNLKKAAFENSRAISNIYGYDLSLIETLLTYNRVKVAGFSGTGPAFYAVIDSSEDENLDEINSFFKNEGNYILTELR